MSLWILIVIGLLLSVGFHFIGVYTGAKKTIWAMLVFMWFASFSIAMNEVKPSAYEEIDKIKGLDGDTDKLISEYGDELSLYEFLVIKKAYIKNHPKR